MYLFFKYVVRPVSFGFHCSKRNVAKKKISFLSPAVAFVGAKLPTYCKLAKKESVVKLDKKLIVNELFAKKEELSFSWYKFSEVLWPHSNWLFLAVLGAVTLAYLNVQVPLVMAQLFDVLVLHKAHGGGLHDLLPSIKAPFMSLVSLYALKCLGTLLYSKLLFSVGEDLARDLRLRLFNSIIIKPLDFFDCHRSSDLVDRLSTDVQLFKSSFKKLFSQGLVNIVQTIGNVVSMASLSAHLTSLTVSIVMATVVVGRLLGQKLKGMSKEAQKQNSAVVVVADEAISNVRTVRAFSMEEVEMRRYEQEVERGRELNNRLATGISLFVALSGLSFDALGLSTLMYASLVLQPALSAGSLMSYYITIQKVQSSVGKLSVLYADTVQAMQAGSRIFQFITPSSRALANAVLLDAHKLRGDLSFHAVSFAYPTRKQHMVLEDLSMEVKGGCKVALVGPSGGGKSTIAGLLMRFYDVDEGSIKLDGVDIRRLDPSWLRKKLIGYIGQEPVLFATSIRENIRYGKPDATDQEVVEAARLANAHDFIIAFPHSYDTQLGEKGLSISGGQKQRIAIARALIKQPPMLILDEATSALDSGSEKLVQQAIEEASQGRTVLMIAHRLSTITKADYVAVIEGGSVIEFGKPEELKGRRGPFWHLLRAQQHSK